MTRRWFIILAAAALALTAFSFALSRRDSSDWRSTRSRRIFPFPWQDAQTIDITRPDGRVTRLARSAEGEWELAVADGLADLAAFALVDELAALATLAWREPAPGLEPPAGDTVRIAAVSQLGQRVDIALGAVTGNQRAAVLDNDPSVVYGISQDLLKFIDWPPDRYRNFSLLAPAPGLRPFGAVLFPGGDDPALEVVLGRQGSRWSLERPIAWPADPHRTEQALGWAARLRALAIVAEDTADPAAFGVTGRSPRVRVAYRGGEGGTVAITREVAFGDPVPGADAVYARVEGRTPVFAVPARVLAELGLDSAPAHPEAWVNSLRKRSLDLLGDGLPVAVTVERLLPRPARLTIERSRERDAPWRARLEQGGAVETFAVEPPLASEPSRPLTALLAGLSRLRVRTFLADAAPGAETIAWTGHPAWRITCQFADGGSSRELTLYAADDQGALPPGEPFRRGLAAPQDMTPQAGLVFSLQGVAAVMESHPDAAHLLCLPPYRYRSPQIMDSDIRTWRRVEIAGPEATRIYQRDSEGLNEQWWLAEPEAAPLLDDNNLFVGTLLRLSQLRAEAYVALAPEAAGEFGLDQPHVTAIVYGLDPDRPDGEGDGTVFRLDIGDISPERSDERYARLDGSGPVFLVPDALAAALAAVYE